MEDTSSDDNPARQSKRGSYKRYVHHNSKSQIPKRTKRYWKRKRKATRRAEHLSKTKNQRTMKGFKSSTEPDRASNTSMEDSADGSLITNMISDDLNVAGPSRLHSEECEDKTSIEEETEEDEDIQLPNRCADYSKDFLITTLLCLATKLRHNLTFEAAQDIVKLLSVMSAAVITRATKYYWKNVINDFSACMTVHYICECGSYVGVQLDQPLHCGNCNKTVDATSKSNQVFIHISLTHQLREILESTRLHDILNEKRKKYHDAALEDVRDGKLYKKINIFDKLTINFSVDGVPVFSSSNFSMHPILCTINELGPQLKNHVLLCSLWFGKGKPNINEYLKPFVAEAQQLYNIGVDYVYQGTSYNKKFCILAAVTDSVARPTLRGSTQFNGKYGCGLCLHPGEAIVKGKGKVRVYPLAADGNPFGEGLRTHNATMDHAIRKEKGIKDRSILCDIPGFDIISSLDVDWMHAVALGVCRQFAKLWFDSTNNNEAFYFGNLVGEVDELLLSFQPSLEVSRTPRLMSERTYWKAHEWVIFLFFYSLPILLKLFPRKLTNHWSLLVDGVQILCKTSVMKSEIVYAERSLLAFISGVEQLYGRKHVSFNVHLLAHLARSVENLGPLWTHSAFVYEDANQALLKYIQSSNGVTVQICDTFRSKCLVDRLKYLLYDEMSNEQKNYLNRVLNNKMRPSATLILEDVALLGAVTIHETLPRDVCLAFERANVVISECTSIQSYKRVVFHGEKIHSKSYTLVKKRYNYYVLLVNDEIFEVQLFYVLKGVGYELCYALGKYFEKSNSPLIKDRRLEHLVVLPKCLDELAVINISMIREKVTMLHLNDPQVSLACIHPNHCELLT